MLLKSGLGLTKVAPPSIGEAQAGAPLTEAAESQGSRNPQLLAANSFLFGTTNLLVLNLPQEWTLRTGYQRPEVDARHVVGEVNWATLGSAHYYVRGPETTGLVELWVRLRPKPRPVQGEPIEVAGHAGTLRRWQDARRLEHLLIRWSCPKSGRAVELEAQGRDSMDELANALQACQCHKD